MIEDFVKIKISIYYLSNVKLIYGMLITIYNYIKNRVILTLTTVAK